MKKQLDMVRIAKGLGAVRGGKISAKGGYFGALGLVADVEARFRATTDVVEAAPTSSGPRTCRSRRPWPCKPSAPPVDRLAQWHRGHRPGRASFTVGARSNQFLTSSAR